MLVDFPRFLGILTSRPLAFRNGPTAQEPPPTIAASAGWPAKPKAGPVIMGVDFAKGDDSGRW